MFTKLSILQRIQVGLILGAAFLLVLASNRLDENHFNTVQNTVNSVYQDRVVVQDYIYQLNKIFHGKELRIVRYHQPNAASSENNKIDIILKDFRNTKLTSHESALLEQLESNFSKLAALETSVGKSWNEKNQLTALNYLKRIQQKLDGLAEVQLDESSQLTKLSNKSLGINSLMSRLEIAFLIIIGVLMIALIFYPEKGLKVV